MVDMNICFSYFHYSSLFICLSSLSCPPPFLPVALFLYQSLGSRLQLQVWPDERSPHVHAAAAMLLCGSQRDHFLYSDHDDSHSKQDPQYGLAHLPSHLHHPLQGTKQKVCMAPPPSLLPPPPLLLPLCF